MYIQKLEAWTDVGYLEGSLSVPYNKTINKDPTWFVENVRPSTSALFSMVKLPIDDVNRKTLDNYLNTKYLSIKFDLLSYNIFGWVDDVVITSTKTVAIFWHTDYWRTYFDKCTYTGWIKRRLPGDHDPYHTFPSFSNHGCLEDVVLARQKRGIAWVLLIYLEGDSFFGATVQAAINAIPGAAAVKTIGRVVLNLTNGFVSTCVANAKQGAQYYTSDVDIKSAFPFLPDYEVVRCLTFPISVNCSEPLYFNTGNRGDNWAGCTYMEVVNGTLAKAMSINPGNLISCHVSPVCPLYDAGGPYNTGVISDYAILVRERGPDINIPTFYSKEQRIIKSLSKGNVGYFKINGFGIRNIGNINEGCPKLSEILDKYFAWFYKIADFTYKSEDGTLYHVEVNRPDVQAGGYMLAPLEVVLDLTYPTWRQYTVLIVRDLVTQAGNKYTSRLFYANVDDAQVQVGRWVMRDSPMPKPDVGTSFIWKYIDDTLGYIDICNNKDGKNFKADYIYFNHDICFICDEEKQRQKVRLDQLFVGICTFKEAEEELDFEFKDLKLSQFDPGCIYSAAQFRSINSMDGRAGIQSKTMNWPIITAKLDKTYCTDDYHDLVLIGMNGNILHRFKTGVEINEYSYQTVTAGPNAYIKLRFKTNNQYAMASDCEVNVPLTPMTAFAEYSNPWKYLNEDAQRFVRYQIENEKISAMRDIEDQNLQLKYDRENEGLKNVGINFVKDTLNNVANTIAPAVDTVVGTVVNTAANAGEWAIGGMMDVFGLKKPGESVFGDAGKRQQEAADRAAKTLSKGPLFPTTRNYQDREKAIRNEQRKAEDRFRDLERSIGGYNIDPPSRACLSIGDTSWIHEYGALRLVYITKDEYSVNSYHESVEMLGIDVNEYMPDKQKISPGPLKVDPVRVLGDNIPKNAIDYIRARLEAGVYVDKNL